MDASSYSSTGTGNAGSGYAPAAEMATPGPLETTPRREAEAEGDPVVAGRNLEVGRVREVEPKLRTRNPKPRDLNLNPETLNSNT